MNPGKMKKESFMKIVLWLLAGSLLVGVPYALAYDAHSLWPSVYAGIAGAAVYLTALAVNFFRNERGLFSRAALVVVIAILLGSTLWHWLVMDGMSSWQRSTLGTIRTTIGRAVIVDKDVTRLAVPLFADYHRQHGAERQSIVSLYEQMNGGELRPVSSGASERTVSTVRFLGDTSVVFITVDTVAHGWNPRYPNSNGSVGRLQLTTIVNAREVRYERNN